MTELVFANCWLHRLHVLPSTPLRARLIALLGRQGFLWAFSAVSVLLFIWIWLAYRSIFIAQMFWITGPVIRWMSAFVMLGVITMVVLAVAQKPPVLLTAETALRPDEALRGVVRHHASSTAVGGGAYGGCCICSTMPIRRAGCSSAISRCWRLAAHG